MTRWKSPGCCSSGEPAWPSGTIVGAMVHTCPRCELRFETDTELEDHLEVDHHVDLEHHVGDPDDDGSRPL